MRKVKFNFEKYRYFQGNPVNPERVYRVRAGVGNAPVEALSDSGNWRPSPFGFLNLMDPDFGSREAREIEINLL